MKSAIYILLAALATACLAQDRPASQTGHFRVMTATRLVAVFSDLERQWLVALEQKDRAALDQLMSEDFQAWTPEPPGEPMPRDEWMPKAAGIKSQAVRLRQMSVRDLGNTALVCFVLSQPSGDWFVVDVWTKHGDAWQVTDRYLSRLSGAHRVPSAKTTDKRPTGKE
jgi:hypothetical protein